MMIANNLNNSCNSSRCSICNFRFVCASSPYCSFKNNSSNTNIDSVIKTLSQSQIEIYSKQMNIIQDINSKIEDLSNSISNILELIKSKDLQTDTAPSSQTVYSGVSFEKINTEEDGSPTEIIPASVPQSNEKIIVEKKGLFGRKKWVEQKAK